MKKINNKGYMLVEIILASVLAMIVAYFVIELTIKLKNKNDDLLVKTLVSTDQAIIYNTIMSDVYENGKDTFSCDKIKIDNNKFVYNGETISLVSEYADVQFDSSDTTYCDDSGDEIKIKIPIKVKQLPNDNFDVVIGDVDVVNNDGSVVSCSLELTSENEIVASTDYDENNMVYYGFSSSYEGDNVTSKTISSTGTYTYYIKTKNNTVGKCSIEVRGTEATLSCPDNYSLSGSSCTLTQTYYATKSYSCSCGYKINDVCNGAPSSTSYDTDAKCQSYCSNNYDISCGYTFKENYTCNSGYTKYPLAVGGYGCRKTTTIDATVESSGCDNEYSKANDSYCWKMVE